MVYITYNKKGLITKHKTLAAAKKRANVQALKGQDSFIDKLTTKGSVNVTFIPGLTKKQAVKKVARKIVKKIRRK